MKTVIEMAREAGWPDSLVAPVIMKKLAEFAELVRADERKKWEDQTAVEIHEAVLDEREACAKVCENGVDTEHPTVKGHIMKDFGASGLLAAAIRARGQA